MDWGTCLDKGVATLSCIIPLFQNILSAALMFVGVVAVFTIIIGGVRFITSRGDPKQIEGAKGVLTWGIIGLVLILFSFMIIKIIAFATGVDVITKFGFPTP